MRKKSIYRGFLIAAGLVAALVIILSHSLSLDGREARKSATEQPTESDKGVILTAPADAVPQGSIVRVDEQVPVSVLEILGEPQRLQNFVPRSEKILSGLFKTLFRVLIAPNAP